MLILSDDLLVLLFHQLFFVFKHFEFVLKDYQLRLFVTSILLEGLFEFPDFAHKLTHLAVLGVKFLIILLNESLHVFLVLLSLIYHLIVLLGQYLDPFS